MLKAFLFLSFIVKVNPHKFIINKSLQMKGEYSEMNEGGAGV